MEACGLKFQRLTKIPCSFPGLLQPVNKKTGQKSKKKTGHQISKKIKHIKVRGGNT